MKTRSNMTGWTDERVATLRRMWDAGDSASFIAKALGSLSRSAVLGKVHRLGLDSRRAPSKPGERRVQRRAPIPQAPRTRIFKTVPLPPLRGVTTQGDPRPWITRQFGECAYPVAGEGADTLSCCNSTDGANYCAFHRAVMFAKPATPAQIAAAKRAREAKAKAMQREARAA